ncbi:hypothetical protein [Fervidibacter sp.]
MLKFFGSAKALPSRNAVPPFANRRSLLAAVYHSLLAIRCHFTIR